MGKSKCPVREQVAGTVDQDIKSGFSPIQEVCLLKQKFVKDDSLTVEQCLQGLIARLGEKIKINRFVRFEI